MEWSFVHVFPPNYPNRIRLGWSPHLGTSTHVLHMFLHMVGLLSELTVIDVLCEILTYCHKDPQHVLGHYLICTIIFKDHVQCAMVIGLIL